MACSWQILNRKVAFALLALSIYGLLLIFVSTDNMNPRFIISSLKNRYMALPWADHASTTAIHLTSNTTTTTSLHGLNSSSSSPPSPHPAINTSTTSPSFIYHPLHTTPPPPTHTNISLTTSSLTNTTNVTTTRPDPPTTVTTTRPDPPTTVTTTRPDLPTTVTTTRPDPPTTTTTFPNVTTNYSTNPLLVLFTTFRNSPEKTHIYQNTIRNWQSLWPWVQPVLYTIDGELDMSRYAQEHGWHIHPVPRKSKQGVPILRHMFLYAQDHYNATYYGYANGDILFTKGLVDTLETIKSHLHVMKQLLIVGRRTNYQLAAKQQITSLDQVVKYGKKGKLFSTNAQDYFISTRDGYPWKTIPDFVVGRVGYDNWLVVTALVKRMYTIDTTETMLALHQTGKDGNYAGHSKKPKGDTYINYGLAGKRFDYSLGHVSCGQFLTKLDKGKPKVVQRSRNGCERTFKRYHVSPYLSLKKQRRRLVL